MIEHFAYPLPFNSELRELNLVPYRTNKQLKDKIHYIFSHVKFAHRELYLDLYSLNGGNLLINMANVATGAMRYFLQHPQQFGNAAENIHLQILVRMWRQSFRVTKLNEIPIDKYHGVKMTTLSIENGFIEELIRTCVEQDFIQTEDDMVKPLSERGIDTKQTKVMYDLYWNKCEPDIRARKSLGTQDEDSKNFRAIANMADNERGSLL